MNRLRSRSIASISAVRRDLVAAPSGNQKPDSPSGASIFLALHAVHASLNRTATARLGSNAYRISHFTSISTIGEASLLSLCVPYVVCSIWAGVELKSWEIDSSRGPASSTRAEESAVFQPTWKCARRTLPFWQQQFGVHLERAASLQPRHLLPPSQGPQKAERERPRPQVTIASRLPVRPPEPACVTFAHRRRAVLGSDQGPRLSQQPLRRAVARVTDAGRRTRPVRSYCAEAHTTISGSFGSLLQHDVPSHRWAGNQINPDPRGWVAAPVVISPSPSSVSMA